MNASKQKTTDLFFKKSNLYEKKMPLKLFEFQKQLMIDTFLIKLAQIEKTGSIGKIFSSQGNLYAMSVYLFVLKLLDSCFCVFLRAFLILCLEK